MDIVFEAPETKIYEDWLGSPAGQRYARASNRLVDRILDCRQGWRVLDVGCGLGLHLAHLRERGLLCQGLEAGPVAARLAGQRLGSQVGVEVGDAHDLPHEDNSFDAVILVNTLELVDRRAQVLAEAARVAASRVCLITHNPLSWSFLSRRLPGRPQPPVPSRGLPLWSLRRLVREVLGPVPQTWASAPLWPGLGPGPWLVGGLVGVCAAVTPRLRTRPLLAPAAGKAPAPRPAHSHGRVTALHGSE